MSGYMKNGAVVEPDAVKKMKASTDQLAENLKKTSDSLMKRTEDLNNSFQDGNFEQLYKVITNNKENIIKLNKVMGEFSVYLAEVEKNIRELIGGATLKGENINIQ